MGNIAGYGFRFGTGTGIAGGAGFVVPDSATLPFADISARNTWAAANLADLIQNQTVVSVTGSPTNTWFLWRGASNPASHDATQWLDATPLVRGAMGAAGAAGIAGAAGMDGRVQTIAAGNRITVDSTDPANPVVTAAVQAFTTLSDTPAALLADRYVRANSAGDGLELGELPTIPDDITDLSDTPVALGTDGQILAVNSAETALEFVDSTTGPQGPAGERGPAGETGPAGPAGVMGLMGDTGATGPAGMDGAAGETTFTGLTDTPAGITANQFVRGNAGGTALEFVTAPSGGSGNFLGLSDTPAAFTADNFIRVNNAGDALEFTTEGVTGPAGPTGDTGATGPAGQQGAMGLRGETGAMGLTGQTGDTGPAGGQGEMGIQGDTGPVGVQGAIGPAGAMGLRGETGAAGTDGMDGTNGMDGERGLQGEMGLQGNTGSTGAMGLQGAIGPTGAMGLRGETGSQGETGQAGMDGAAGSTTFTGLTDTPASFTANQFLRANSGGNALEFTTVPSAGFTIQDSGTQEGTGITTVNFNTNLDVSVAGSVATVNSTGAAGAAGNWDVQPLPTGNIPINTRRFYVYEGSASITRQLPTQPATRLTNGWHSFFANDSTTAELTLMGNFRGAITRITLRPQQGCEIVFYLGGPFYVEGPARDFITTEQFAEWEGNNLVQNGSYTNSANGETWRAGANGVNIDNDIPRRHLLNRLIRVVANSGSFNFDLPDLANTNASLSEVPLGQGFAVVNQGSRTVAVRPRSGDTITSGGITYTFSNSIRMATGASITIIRLSAFVWTLTSRIGSIGGGS